MNLKQLREAKNLTQTKVAKEIGISRPNYHNYEKGLTEPNIETLIKIADYYETSIDRLVNRQYFNVLFLDNLTNEQKEVVKVVTELNPIQLGNIQAYLQILTGRITVN
jgi:transcriptional regulator with XRE-family HTH domain